MHWEVKRVYFTLVCIYPHRRCGTVAVGLVKSCNRPRRNPPPPLQIPIRPSHPSAATLLADDSTAEPAQPLQRGGAFRLGKGFPPRSITTLQTTKNMSYF